MSLKTFSAYVFCMLLKKNVCSALMVVKQMKEAGVKPDSITYGYLINNCNREDTITKVSFRSLVLWICVNAITTLYSLYLYVVNEIFIYICVVY